MYVPHQFVENNLSVLHETIKRLRFGSLVTLNGQSLLASHVPMFLDNKTGDRGTLEGHISKANPQGADIEKSVQALAIFTGPNAYISPTWYETKKEHGRAVPTWNYIAVHAYGPLEIIEDPTWLLDHLTKLTNHNEEGRKPAWSINDAPKDYINAQLGGILGWRMSIERIEGAWKMIQHHPEGNRIGTISGLSESKNPGDVMVSDVMKDLELQRRTNK